MNKFDDDHDKLILASNNNKNPEPKNEIFIFTLFKKKFCKIINKLIFIYICLFCLHISLYFKLRKTYVYLNKNKKNKSEIDFNQTSKLNIALCTMGKGENLYAKEFVDYYLKLGIDHIFIYDDNDPNTEKFTDVIGQTYKDVTIFENIKDKIRHQSTAFTDCYERNKLKYDWFLMIDMDEFLYLVEDNNIKEYISNHVFDKCDFIKFHWAHSTDNGLVHYDNRSLFERFKPPYLSEHFVKTMIRGNISELEYWVHSPLLSPIKNISCFNNGEIINKKKVIIESIDPVNFDKAILIHFRYKSTEEFIAKYKRGYSDWLGDSLKDVLNSHVNVYFEQNKITLEKINYMEKELKINLWNIRLKYYISKILFFGL